MAGSPSTGIAFASPIPQRIGDFDPTGATVVFDTSVDDYAEVWVDGELPRAAGQSGGSVVKGWNAENRLIVARDVRPGQQIQLAVFGANGPLSSPPTNFIYLRYAKLEFHRGGSGPYAVTPQEVNVDVLRLDPAIDVDRSGRIRRSSNWPRASNSPKGRSGRAAPIRRDAAVLRPQFQYHLSLRP